MNNPYLLLDVPMDADDAAVKKAYLRKVREYPPDRSPEQFQEIRNAFEKISGERERVHHMLFDKELPDPTEIALLLLRHAPTASPVRPGEDLLSQAMVALATEAVAQKTGN